VKVLQIHRAQSNMVIVNNEVRKQNGEEGVTVSRQIIRSHRIFNCKTVKFAQNAIKCHDCLHQENYRIYYFFFKQSSFAYTLVYHLCVNLEHSVVFFF